MSPVHEIVAYGRTDFYGWPANHGIWRFGDDIFVGFSKGAHRYNGFDLHAYDHDVPLIPMFARLSDGVGWVHEFPTVPAILLPPARVPPEVPAELLSEKSALYFQTTGFDDGAVTQLLVSLDEGRSWQGPFRVPDFGMRGVSSRTDYLVCDGYFLLGMTGVKPDGDEGTAFAARLWFDGRWEMLGMIGDMPPKGDFRIMPALARLPDGKLLAVTRYACEYKPGCTRLEAYISGDGGKTWVHGSDFAVIPGDMSGGSPPAIAVNSAGTVIAAYCRRQAPHGVFLTATRDGKHWSAPAALRTDAVNTDIGYPRMIVKDDIAYIVYYYTLGEEEPRFIAATRASVREEDLK